MVYVFSEIVLNTNVLLFSCSLVWIIVNGIPENKATTPKKLKKKKRKKKRKQRKACSKSCSRSSKTGFAKLVNEKHKTHEENCD